VATVTIEAEIERSSPTQKLAPETAQATAVDATDTG
jgi:hypothetical protein